MEKKDLFLIAENYIRIFMVLLVTEAELKVKLVNEAIDLIQKVYETMLKFFNDIKQPLNKEARNKANSFYCGNKKQG